MLGLFGTFNIGQRALLANQQAIEVAGHNIANVNNPAYARQRVMLQTSPAIDGPGGPSGSGVAVERITSIRSQILDGEMISEASTSGSLGAQKDALQTAQADLGEQLDAIGSPTTGLGARLSGFFSSWQALSADPSSLTARQSVLQNSVSLANEFQGIDRRLTGLHTSLNTQLQTDTATANGLLADIARLNGQIESSESGTGATANDLRDSRQQKLEQLSALVNFDSATGTTGGVNISVGGVALVTEGVVSDRFQAYDPGSGSLMLRAESAGTALHPTSGRLAGTITSRDGGVAQLQSSIDTLAATLIQQVNTLHGPGYGLNGTSGVPFFNGSGSGNIQVNTVLTADPTRVQAAAVAGAAGDNQVARGIATLADQAQGALGGITFGQSYSTAVGSIGSSLSSVTQSLADQKSVESLLGRQRSSISGVSMDEELSDLSRYQKAYEASARLMSTVNVMLETVINLGR